MQVHLIYFILLHKLFYSVPQFMEEVQVNFVNPQRATCTTCINKIFKKDIIINHHLLETLLLLLFCFNNIKRYNVLFFGLYGLTIPFGTNLIM